MPGAQIIDFSTPSKSMKMKDTAIDGKFIRWYWMDGSSATLYSFIFIYIDFLVVKLAAGDSEQTIMKMELQPGWNWTGCIRENIPGKPEKYPGSHLGICMKGEFKMYHEDGSVVSA